MLLAISAQQMKPEFIAFNLEILKRLPRTRLSPAGKEQNEIEQLWQKLKVCGVDTQR